MPPDIRSQRCIEIHISGVLTADDDRVDAVDGRCSSYSIVTCVLPSGRR